MINNDYKNSTPITTVLGIFLISYSSPHLPGHSSPNVEESVDVSTHFVQKMNPLMSKFRRVDHLHFVGLADFLVFRWLQTVMRERSHRCVVCRPSDDSERC